MNTAVWWIIVAIIVVIAIIVLITLWQIRRRTAAKRNEARELRGQAKEREGAAAAARHRAGAASEAAQRAHAEADAHKERAQQLETQATYEGDAAAAVERDQAETFRRADQIDPDTPTDRDGNRVTDGREGEDETPQR